MKTRAATARIAAQINTRPAARTAAKPLLVFPGGAPMRTLQNASGLLSRLWQWIREHQAVRSDPRRLRVASTVSLGEKRFAAVLQVDGLEFLVGGSSNNVALLAQLKGDRCFSSALKDSLTAAKKQPAVRVRKQAVGSESGQGGNQA